MHQQEMRLKPPWPWVKRHHLTICAPPLAFVEDGTASLNVDLVRAGVFPGAVMADMVDNFNGLNELLKDPKLAATKAEIEKERAEAPQDRAERLIADDDYELLMDRVEVAENQAHSEKLGIWSDAMKEERESEGYP
jgi:NACalpha-BTF3-like transcription factor